MRGSIRIARISGIDVFIHWTFSFLILFIIYVNYRAGGDLAQMGWTLLFVATLFFIVTLHELGHAFAARRYHIKTKDITLLPIGGVARLENMPEKPSEELVVALAGPLVNVVLAIIMGLFLSMPENPEEALKGLTGINASNFLFNVLVINIFLAVFNLIPAFPMDGGRVLRAFISMWIPRHKATFIAARIGQLIAVVFIIGGFYANPFLIFIGLFIILGAQAEAEQTKTSFMLKGAILRDALMKQFEVLQEDDPIQKAVDKLLNGQSKNFIVVANQVPVGTLNRDEIIKALSAVGTQEKVGHAMNSNLLKFPDTEPLETAYRKMAESNTSVALVYHGEKITGIVDSENIMEYILVKTALKQG